MTLFEISSYLLIGVLIGGILFILYKKGGADFVKDSFQEFVYKVSWPSYKELQKMFALCFIGTLIIVSFVGGANYFWGTINKNLFP